MACRDYRRRYGRLRALLPSRPRDNPYTDELRLVAGEKGISLEAEHTHGSVSHRVLLAFDGAQLMVCVLYRLLTRILWVTDAVFSLASRV